MLYKPQRWCEGLRHLLTFSFAVKFSSQCCVPERLQSFITPTSDWKYWRTNLILRFHSTSSQTVAYIVQADRNMEGGGGGGGGGGVSAWSVAPHWHLVEHFLLQAADYLIYFILTESLEGDCGLKQQRVQSAVSTDDNLTHSLALQCVTLE